MDDAFITPSDLNTVLGVRKGVTYYLVSGTPLNLPDGLSGDRFVLEVLNSSGMSNSFDVIQRITARSSNITYQRSRTNRATDAWTNWVAFG